MTKKIHTKSKIFFPNPYVVRVQFPPNMNYDDAERKFGIFCRRTYREITGTWGHSKLEIEQIGGLEEVILSGATVLTLAPNLVLRGYFVFKDEMDALQFMLSIDADFLQVNIWPERWFTIHENIESSE